MPWEEGHIIAPPPVTNQSLHKIQWGAWRGNRTNTPGREGDGGCTGASLPTASVFSGLARLPVSVNIHNTMMLARCCGEKPPQPAATAGRLAKMER